MLPLLDEFDIKGMAHITGGGFYDNIPRILPAELQRHHRAPHLAHSAHLLADPGARQRARTGDVPHLQYGHRLHY